MKRQKYKDQVKLLLNVLPEVVEEKCFGLHGGTAINLFVRDMPRLSVDIDLTYLPIEDRSTTLSNVNKALERIKNAIEKSLPSVQVTHIIDSGKLLVRSKRKEIKIEVNLIGRGVISDITKMPLCDRAQSEFDVFVVFPIVPLGQLYGGKICAALDRQHPRDLFDVKYLLENEKFSDEVKHGFLLSLISSDRPINEVVVPSFQDQRQAMKNQFSGMAEEEFSYDEFERVREDLIQVVRMGLTDEDKSFLLSIKDADPDWGFYDFERFPAVQWKLQNLIKLKKNNPKKHKEQYEALKEKLYS